MSGPGNLEQQIVGQDLIGSTNKLLEYVGISSKRIKSIDELIRVSSSMFVTVYEALFRTRLENIIRLPRTDQDYAANCQSVVNSLSIKVQMDLRHITGDLIVRGNKRALSNLVNIFLRIASLAR